MKPSQWLIDATAAAKTHLLSDMIIEGEISPQESKEWILPPLPSGKVYTSGFKKYLSDKGEKIKLKESLNGARRALYDLVEKEISVNPIAAEGRQWAELSAARIADKLGISEDHARRLYKGNPFRHVVKAGKAAKKTLIRIGHPSDLTAEDQARMMAKFWRSDIGHKEAKGDFGLLVGIAKDCPQGLGYDVFRTVVANWSPFMCGVKLAQHIGQIDGDEYDKNPANFHSRFLIFPCISVIRRFIYVALDFYGMAVQELLSEPKCPDVCNQIINIINYTNNK